MTDQYRGDAGKVQLCGGQATPATPKAIYRAHCFITGRPRSGHSRKGVVSGMGAQVFFGSPDQLQAILFSMAYSLPLAIGTEASGASISSCSRAISPEAGTAA